MYSLDKARLKVENELLFSDFVTGNIDRILSKIKI